MADRPHYFAVWWTSQLSELFFLTLQQDDRLRKKNIVGQSKHRLVGGLASSLGV